MRILCCSDVHIGQTSTRLPQDLPAQAFSCAAGWNRIVDLAIRHEADLLLIGGDLIDRNNRYYEAQRAVQSGLERLAAAGIQVVAVAGNHDWDTLHDLSENLGLRVLGKGGKWEAHDVFAKGETLRLIGWSFPDKHFGVSPLHDAALPPANGLTIGLLHTDFRVANSVFAPTTDADFVDRHGVSLWLIGHVHKPAHHQVGSTAILNPGSPHPLDPGEPGTHGPWWVEVSGGRITNVRQEPSALVRYDSLRLDLGEVADPSAIRVKVHRCLGDWCAEQEFGATEVVVLRLKLEMRTAMDAVAVAAVCRTMSGMDGDEPLDQRYGGVRVVVERADWTPLPPEIDLAARAQDPDAIGKIASLILQLDAPEELRETWVCDVLVNARNELIAVDQEAPYRKLFDDQAGESDDPKITQVDVVAMVREQSLRLLNELMTQKVTP